MAVAGVPGRVGAALCAHCTSAAVVTRAAAPPSVMLGLTDADRTYEAPTSP